MSLSDKLSVQVTEKANRVERKTEMRANMPIASFLESCSFHPDPAKAFSSSAKKRARIVSETSIPVRVR